ncbi:hypothetical protein ACOSQ2_024173 [Xanthoceras sorbifolium]
MTLVAKHNQNQRLHTFINSSTPCNTCLILKYSAAMSFLPCDKSAGLAMSMEYFLFVFLLPQYISCCILHGLVDIIFLSLHSSWFGLIGHLFTQLILGKQVTADENFIAKVADAGIRNFFWGELMMHAHLH